MSEPKKNKDSQPDERLPLATPKPERSKIGGIRRTRRGVRPERLIAERKSQPSDIVALEASPLETATRIAAESIAQNSVEKDSIEKTKLAAAADRAKLDLAREDLAREKGARQAAAVDAEDRLAAVHRDLANVHNDAAAARKSLSRERTIRVVMGFAAAVLICAAFFYRSMPGIPDLPVASPAPAPPPRTAKLVPESQDALETPETRFTEGLDRLNLTLASAGSRKAEDAIRTIHDTLSPAVCPFVWRDGQVSLTFNEDSNLSSLTNTFSRCTDALAQLP
jgi:hypothetical protein